MDILIVGYGFVGKAVEYGFKNKNNIFIADPALGEQFVISNVINKHSYDAIFICVPSPTVNGACDDSIVREILDSLKGVDSIVIIKSTLHPACVRNIWEDFSDLRLAYCPEFLTEANYLNDFITSDIIIGTSKSNIYYLVKSIFANSCCSPNVLPMYTPEEASMIKYGRNCFLATKVIFFNQLKAICTSLDMNSDQFNLIAKGIGMDYRIGQSHTKAPGPDGKYGFGGSCFPKDTQALCTMAKEIGADFTLLEEVIRVNGFIRK